MLSHAFFVSFLISPQDLVHICTLKWPDTAGEIVWNVAFTALCFLLPGLIIVGSYSKILQVSLLQFLTEKDGRKLRQIINALMFNQMLL